MVRSVDDFVGDSEHASIDHSTVTGAGVTGRLNSGSATNSRHQVNFIEGTNISITVVDDAGDGEIEVTVGTSAITSAQHAAIDHFGFTGVGRVIKTQTTFTISDLSSTAIVPDDDTPPTTSETGSALSLAFTPLRSTSTRLNVRGIAQLGRNGPSICMVGLRLNAEANLRSVSRNRIADSLSMRDASVEYDYAHGTTSTQTWNLRFAQITNAGTMYINRTGGGAVGGNTHHTILTVTEYDD